MTYNVTTSSQAVRDIDEAIFYKKGLGTYTDNIEKFKKEVISFIRSLQESPKIGANLSSRIPAEKDVKYFIIQDYILFYRVSTENKQVDMLRLLPAKSNRMNTILKHL